MHCKNVPLLKLFNELTNYVLFSFIRHSQPEFDLRYFLLPHIDVLNWADPPPLFFFTLFQFVLKVLCLIATILLSRY